MPNLQSVKESVSKPIGPLPAYAWVLVIIGGYFGYRYLAGRGTSGTSGTAANTDSSTAAGSLQNSTDLNNLIQSIKDLINKTPTTVAQPGPPGTPIAGSPINPGGGSSGGSSGGGSGGGYTTPASKTTSNITGAIAKSTSDLTGAIGKTTSGLSSAVGVSGAIGKASNNIASVTAIKPIGGVASLPMFSDNTATPRPITDAVNVASGVVPEVQKVIGEAPSLPTISTAIIPASTMQIPATTPTKSIVPAVVATPTPAVKAATQKLATAITPAKAATPNASKLAKLGTSW